MFLLPFSRPQRGHSLRYLPGAGIDFKAQLARSARHASPLRLRRNPTRHQPGLIFSLNAAHDQFHQIQQGLIFTKRALGEN
jgi:hypothetical protein